MGSIVRKDFKNLKRGEPVIFYVGDIPYLGVVHYVPIKKPSSYSFFFVDILKPDGDIVRIPDIPTNYFEYSSNLYKLLVGDFE